MENIQKQFETGTMRTPGEGRKHMSTSHLLETKQLSQVCQKPRRQGSARSSRPWSLPCHLCIVKGKVSGSDLYRGILKGRLGRKPHASRLMAWRDCKHGLRSAVWKSLTRQERGTTKDRAKPSLFLNVGRVYRSREACQQRGWPRAEDILRDGREGPISHTSSFSCRILLDFSGFSNWDSRCSFTNWDFWRNREVKKCSRPRSRWIADLESYSKSQLFCRQMAGFCFFFFKAQKDTPRRKRAKQSYTHL